jgi:hypothetical protein
MHARFLKTAILLVGMASTASADPIKWQLRDVRFGECIDPAFGNP